METIIKIYRSKLGPKKFDSLEGYAKDFLGFLSDNSQLFPKEVQADYFRELIRSYFLQITRAALDECERIVKAQKSIADDKVVAVLETHIQSWCEELSNCKDIECVPQDISSGLEKLYSAIIEKQIESVFGNARISEQSKKPIKDCRRQDFFKRLLPRDRKFRNCSGRIWRTEPFPSLYSYVVQGVLGNKLKFKPSKSASISYSMGASITPFAQDEMVHTFMQGVDPSYEHHAVNLVNEIVKKYYFDPIEKAVNMKEEDKKELLKNLRDIQATAIKELRNKLDRHKRTDYVDPVLDAVAALPKDELAAMAESLVSLTILKRRVSMTAETVGGAIDVALISKGDGLIWIKRKHYFDKNLNAQFLANYYRKDEEDRS